MQHWSYWFTVKCLMSVRRNLGRCMDLREIVEKFWKLCDCKPTIPPRQFSRRSAASYGFWDLAHTFHQPVETSNTPSMATALQKQLTAIAASSTHQLDLKAQKSAHGKSLLFESKIAGSQSFENLYLICHEGYRDLCALDPRFRQFSNNLFSEQSKEEDRLQMTEAENKKLNTVLEAFITLVGPRLLLKPAQKALEWLVRRFKYVLNITVIFVRHVCKPRTKERLWFDCDSCKLLLIMKQSP